VTRRAPAPDSRRHAGRWVPTAVLSAVALVLTACTSAGTAVSTPFSSTKPKLEPGPTYEVKVKDISGLGPVLVDGQGIALYLYQTDRRGSPSRCYGICSVQWPPDTLPTGVSRPVAGPGVVPRLLGTAPRTDGTTQISYNGWPLYFWPPDRTPGTATGQGLTNAGGLWYVLDAEGNAVTTK
jgi:predicted lipoprotein with Yx(FWY)xxD motif